MNPRQWFRVSGGFASAILFAGASLLLVATVPVQAQSAFTAPTTAIGTPSATQTVTVNITTSGKLAAIDVLTQGASGLDYSLVAGGGTCAAGTVYTAPTTCAVQIIFTPTRPWVRYGGISLFDGSNNLLGNSFLNGVGTGPQVNYPLSAATVPSLLGSGFLSALGVAVDGGGNVYVADTGHNAVKELMAVGGVVPASPTIVTWSGFSSPSGVAVDGSGNVYVADTGNNAVKELIAVGGVVPATPTIVSLGAGSYSSPTGVAVDGSGNVYVADMNHNAVEELVAVNGVIPSGVTPTPLGSGFSTPEGVAVDGIGDVFVADTHNSLVKEIVAATSTIKTLGSGFFSAAGVAVDGAGNVYVADTGNNVVKEIVAVGGVIPSSPTIVTLGTGFTAPSGVAVDAIGDVYVADKGNSAAKEMNAQNPPTLAFASTPIGATSSDSPKNLTVANNGNAPLLFTVPTTGSNPSISTNFSLSSSSTCPQLTSTSSSASLLAGQSCMDIVSFAPTLALPLTGSLATVDNNLNVPASTQTISLTGNTPTITVSPASAQVAATSVLLTASVAYGAGAPTGAVTFAVNGGSPVTASCTGSSSPNICTASYNPSSLPVTAAGYSIVATEAAAGPYTASSGTGTLTITQGTPALTLTTSGSPSTVNSSVTFTVAVTPNTGIKPSGAVSFSSTLSGVSTPISGCTSVPLVPGAGPTLTAACTTNAPGGTSALPAGSYSISASIAADTNFVSANSNTVPQAVTPAPTTLSIPTPTSSPAVDTSVSLVATLASTAGFSPTPPAGTVSFSTSSGTIPGCGTVALISNQATCNTTSLIFPADVITAAYSSDLNFQNSTSASVTQGMTKDPTSNTVSSSLQTTAVVNQSVTFTATITPNGATASGVPPTGNVTFTQGSTTLCGGPTAAPVTAVVPASGAGTASCTAAFSSTLSAASVSAAYSGDANFTLGNVASVSQTVGLAPSATTVTSNLSTVGLNSPVILTATVTPANTGAGFPGTAVPQSGSVSFSDSAVPGTTFCPSTLTAGVLSPATCSQTFTLLGPHRITASYTTTTDPNFSSSTIANSVTVTVGTSGIALTLNSPTGPASPTVNQSNTFSASISPFPTGLTASPGTVTYSDGAAIPSCTNLTVTASGTIPTCTDTFLVAGPHSISVAFTPATGGPIPALTSNSDSVTVAQNTPSSAVLSGLTSPASNSSTTSVVDQTVYFAATITPSLASASGATPTGTVSFHQGSAGGATVCGPAVLTSNSNGTASASCSGAFTNAVSATGIFAVYSGDLNFKPGTASSATQTVTAAPTATTVTSNLSAVGINAPVNLTATVAPANTGAGYTGTALPQSGSVSFTDSVAPGTPFCSSPLALVAGVLTYTCPAHVFTSLGSHTITASFTSTDSNFSSSTIANSVTVTANASSATLTVTASPSNLAAPTVDQTGDTFSVAFTNFPTGLTLPVGTVTYYDNGTAITSATCPSVSISSAGVPVSTCSYPFPSAVQHFITAQFVPNTTPGGGSAFSSLTSTNSIAVTVSQTGTSLTVTPPASAQINVSATYQATVSLTGSIADTGLTLPTGMVTFTDTTSSPTVSCTASVTPATGVAQCALTPNTAGNTGSSHTITAAYSGDVNFVTSSKTATETVAKATPTIVINSNLQPSVATQTVTFTAIATASSAVNPPTIPTQVNFTVKAGSTAIPCALLAVNSCSATFPASVSGTVTVDASYAGDPNYAPASTPTNGTTYMQSVQNFTPTVTLSPSTSTLSFAQGSPTQSNTNLIDSFNPVTIQFSPNWSPSTPVDGTSVTACSVTGLTTPLPTCAPTANGSGVVVSATSAVAVGNYALTLTVTDKLNPALSQTTAALPFTIVSQTPAVYVDSLGTASVTFTAPANLSLHCGTQVATYQTSTNSYVVNTTLTNIGITCPSTISSSSNSYTFTITAGTQTVARLETGNGGAVLACLGAPFLLMLGLLPASRKLRKSLLHGLAILALGMLLMHATGCGSGGFPARQGTHATDGTYLLDIVNGTSTVAEVPLVIAN